MASKLVSIRARVPAQASLSLKPTSSPCCPLLTYKSINPVGYQKLSYLSKVDDPKVTLSTLLPSSALCLPTAKGLYHGLCGIKEGWRKAEDF